MSDENELTPEEKMAFDRLPREASPSEFLEERVVRALREDGILEPPVSDATSSRVRRRSVDTPSRWARTWGVAAASMAASLILFGSGVLAGHWLGTRSTERTMLAVREQDRIERALRVQEAGSAYVAALAALAEPRTAARPEARGGDAAAAARAASEIQQGREAAFGALYGAAIELARIAPGDPDVPRILRVLEERQGQQVAIGGARTTVWY